MRQPLVGDGLSLLNLHTRVGGLGGIAASGSGDPVPSITTKRDITQTGPDLVPLQHGPVLHGITDPEELKGEQVEINVCIRHLEDSQVR